MCECVKDVINFLYSTNTLILVYSLEEIDLSFIYYVYRTEFLITASCDGHIKFWKKQDEGIEFVKHFKAHMGKSSKVDKCNISKYKKSNTDKFNA